MVGLIEIRPAQISYDQLRSNEIGFDLIKSDDMISDCMGLYQIASNLSQSEIS